MQKFVFWGMLAAALGGVAALPAKALANPVVVIDAGHGGHDPGAISVLDGQHEKAATLAVAKLVRDELGSSGIDVILTRDDDRFLPLVARRQVAEKKRATLFISLHADSAPNPGAQGASVYTLSEQGAQVVSARFGKRVPAMTGTAMEADVAALLGDLGQRGAVNSAGEFADRLESALGTGIRKRSTFHLPAEFAVLKAIGVPAVLLEMGYVTSEQDAAELFSRSGQKRIAHAISRAIRSQLSKDDRPQLASAD